MDDMYLHKMAKAKIDTLKLLNEYIKHYEEMEKEICIYNEFTRTLKDIKESLDK